MKITKAPWAPAPFLRPSQAQLLPLGKDLNGWGPHHGSAILPRDPPQVSARIQERGCLPQILDAQTASDPPPYKLNRGHSMLFL